MASHIDNLPTEALHDILQRVRTSSTESELPHFASLLSCCQLWHNVAKPILWRDVVLDNDSLPLFLATANRANLALVRSLTISASPSTDWRVKGKPMPTYYVNESVAGRLKRRLYPTHVMWDHLEKLAEIMPRMVTMTSFSFCAQHTNLKAVGPLCDHMRPWTKFALKALLQGLPESCTSIEIDTAGQDDLHPETHLCDMIRQVLSRMKHVRLCLGSICDCAFKPANGVANPMASLETLIINLVCKIGDCFNNSAYRTRDCNAPLTNSANLFHQQDIHIIVPMIEAAINTKACPRATRISIFDVDEDQYPWYDTRNNLKHKSLEEHNLLTNTFTRMPYMASQSRPDSDSLRYVNGEGKSEEAHGNWEDLSMLAESHAWGTTIQGSCLPSSFTKSETAWERGYVFKSMVIRMRGRTYFSNNATRVGTNGTRPKYVEIMDKRTGHITII